MSALKLIGLSLLLVQTSLATDRVDEFILAEMKRQQIPGLSLAIVQLNIPVKVRGYGFANLEHQVEATPETLYQSGSVGKQFTAALILLLVEEGRLRLEDPVSKFFAGAPASWKEITVRHALSHTSGLADYPEDLDLRKDYTQAELLEHLYKVELLFKPGSNWRYSNLAYLLLGYIAEKLESKTYHESVRERIFVPLDMKSARGIEEADVIPHRAAGYAVRESKIENQSWVAPSWNRTADGSHYVSVNDMLRWDHALHKGRLLQRSSYQQMWSPAPLANGKTVPYGFGWAVGNYGDRRVVQHSGHWQGFSAGIFRSLDEPLSVIVLSNRAGVDTLRLARAVAARYDSVLAEPKRKPITLPTQKLQMYGGKYEFFPGATLRLEVKQGRLWATPAGQMQDAGETFELQAESPQAFFHEPLESAATHPWYVTFRYDSAGNLTHLVSHRWGGEFEAPKIE